MKAVVCAALGPPESLRLEERDPGPPGPGQVRVRLRAAGLNFPDVLMIRGGYQLKPPLPFTPGMEAAGEVEAAGPGAVRFAPGDRVVVRMRFGAFAEVVLAAEEQLLPLPAPFGFEEGAAYVVGALTAYHSLVDRGRLRAGETVLVHGAGGGVGLAAVQLARHLGARVIATAGTPEKRAAAMAQGAEAAIDYRDGFRETVKELTGGAGADIVYDPVGGAVLEESLRCIAWRGRLLVVGFTSGGYGNVPANYPLLKGCAVIGVRAGEAARRDPAAGRRTLDAVLRLAGEGLLRPVISHRLPLADVTTAMRLMLDRQVIGKAVLTMPG
jgi:NADPH2:quinone reductase